MEVEEEEGERGGGGGEAGVKFVQVCTSLRKRHFDSSPLRCKFAVSLSLFFHPIFSSTITPIVIIILATMSRRKQPNPNKVPRKCVF